MGDRAFYRHYLLLAVPMILQNAITNLVSFLDNTGHLLDRKSVV